MSAPVARLRVKRGTPEDDRGHEVFEEAFEPGQSRLDGLRRVRAEQDASLAIRFACINANACKECIVKMNGKTVYACTTRLVEGEMTVEPLPNKPLLRDLVTDIAPDHKAKTAMNSR